jgi:hypothetical protein
LVQTSRLGKALDLESMVDASFYQIELIQSIKKRKYEEKSQLLNFAPLFGFLSPACNFPDSPLPLFPPSLAVTAGHPAPRPAAGPPSSPAFLDQGGRRQACGADRSPPDSKGPQKVRKPPPKAARGHRPKAGGQEHRRPPWRLEAAPGLAPGGEASSVRQVGRIFTSLQDRPLPASAGPAMGLLRLIRIAPAPSQVVRWRRDQNLAEPPVSGRRRPGRVKVPLDDRRGIAGPSRPMAC